MTGKNELSPAGNRGTLHILGEMLGNQTDNSLYNTSSSIVIKPDNPTVVKEVLLLLREIPDTVFSRLRRCCVFAGTDLPGKASC